MDQGRVVRRSAAPERAFGFKRSSACALAVLALLCPSAAGLVHAEDAGIRDFLSSEGGGRRAAPAARPAPSAAPARPALARSAPVRSPVLPRFEVAQPRRSPAPPAVRKPPRTAFASLPQPAARERVRAEPAQVSRPKRVFVPAASDPVAAILNDSTLRRGDIVMFPEGPRVFTGSGRAPFKRSAFEPIQRSNVLSNAERRSLLGRAVVAGAAGTRPARVAAAPDPELKPSTGGGVQPAADQVAAVRVVYPVR